MGAAEFDALQIGLFGTGLDACIGWMRATIDDVCLAGRDARDCQGWWH